MTYCKDGRAPLLLRGGPAALESAGLGLGLADDCGRTFTMSKTWKEKSTRFLKQARSFLFVVLVVLSFRSSIADWNDVPTGSMKPTIMEGDRVFVNKLAYDLKVPFTTWHLAQWDNPKRGDIVVFFSPADGQRLVKRVVGLPGDRIELANNELLVNGAP